MIFVRGRELVLSESVMLKPGESADFINVPHMAPIGFQLVLAEETPGSDTSFSSEIIGSMAKITIPLVRVAGFSFEVPNLPANGAGKFDLRITAREMGGVMLIHVNAFLSRFNENYSDSF